MNYSAKKSLGQNFLIDKNIIEKIVNFIDIKDKSILEIGPGTGNLTSSLIEKNPKKFFVIEKDNNLASLLETQFRDKITIINDDVLKINEKFLCKDRLIVFGNLPYNISTEILCKWILNLENENIWFDNLILMFQKEVADRIISNYNCSNYGRLTILANWKLNIKKIIDIKPNSFNPKPKVDSSLLFFSPKKNFFKIKDPHNLEKVTRIFFSHRRKMIKKPFSQIFSNNLDILNKLNINLNLRPQNLDFETYYKLTSEYEKLIG
jgi:16S rRNA (adenine1518-N6/adenine1519-N6)-dimethyltransferase|tara:strand:- start:166 stop:957 length:792 start_codon:yes stop_codon:yes gene_type:complete